MEKTTINKSKNIKGIIALILVILATLWTLIIFSKLGKNLEITMSVYGSSLGFAEKIVIMLGFIIIQLVLSIISFFLVKSERKSQITKINTVTFYLSVLIFISVAIQSIIILSA